MFEQFIRANHLLWSNPPLTSSLSTPPIHAPSPQLLFPTLICSSWNPLSPLGAASVYMGLEVTLWYMGSLSHGSFDSIAVWLLPLAARHRSVWTCCWDILFSLNWIIESLILTKTHKRFSVRIFKTWKLLLWWMYSYLSSWKSQFIGILAVPNKPTIHLLPACLGKGTPNFFETHILGSLYFSFFPVLRLELNTLGILGIWNSLFLLMKQNINGDVVNAVINHIYKMLRGVWMWQEAGKWLTHRGWGSTPGRDVPQSLECVSSDMETWKQNWGWLQTLQSSCPWLCLSPVPQPVC